MTLALLLALTTAALLPFSAWPAVLLLATASVLHWRDSAIVWLSPLSLIMLGWLVWLPLSMGWSLSPGHALSHIAVLLCLPLGWVVGVGLVEKRRLHDLCAWLPAVLLLVFALWGAIQGPATFTGKPQGPFNDPNAFAALLNMLMLPVLAVWLSLDPRNSHPLVRTVSLSLLAGGLYVFFLIASRGAALALMLAVPLLLLKSAHMPAFRKKLVLLFMVGIGAFFAAFATTNGLSVAARLAETVQQGDQSRWLLMKSAWEMVLEHPWLGTGLGSFRLLYPRFRSPEEVSSAGGWVHNDYLQLWMEAGLPMLLLCLALVVWVGWRIWRTLISSSQDAPERLGYLLGVAAVLVHAMFNFLFFFASISLLVGLYLARASSPSAPLRDQGNTLIMFNPLRGDRRMSSNEGVQALRLMAAGYAVIMGLLLFGQAFSSSMVARAQDIQRLFRAMDIDYPHYQVIQGLSYLSPYNPAVQQTLGLELASAVPTEAGGGDLLYASLKRMRLAQRLIPCFKPYASDALALLAPRKLEDEFLTQARLIVEEGLACDPHHSLTYWYAGQVAEQRTGGDALAWWQAGLAVSNSLSGRLLLISAILSRELPDQQAVLSPLAVKVAEQVRFMEANPAIRANQPFWSGVQNQLDQCCSPRYRQLLQAPMQLKSAPPAWHASAARP